MALINALYRSPQYSSVRVWRCDVNSSKITLGCHERLCMMCVLTVLVLSQADEEPASGYKPQQLGRHRGRGGAAHHAHAHRLAECHAQRSGEQERRSQRKYNIYVTYR